MAVPALGICFPRELSAPLVREFAEAVDGRLDELWVVEDCFYTTATSLAATALARTETLRVGLGILPAVARTAAFTAMELATIANLAPGRLVAGIGHGVQEWMGQMGVRPASPVTALAEVLDSVHRLLAGERVTFHGDYVTLEDVQLEQPPSDPPRLLAGVRGPRSLAMAGTHADGVVLAELAGPAAITRALGHARPEGPNGRFDVHVFAGVAIDDDRQTARRFVAPWLAGMVGQRTPELQAAPFFDELDALVAGDGPDGIMAMPDDWWGELGAYGTPDDAAAFVERLGAAGATSVSFFLPPVVEFAREQRDRILAHLGAT